MEFPTAMGFCFHPRLTSKSIVCKFNNTKGRSPFQCFTFLDPCRCPALRKKPPKDRLSMAEEDDDENFPEEEETTSGRHTKSGLNFKGLEDLGAMA